MGDPNDSDMDGSISNQEEEDDLRDDEYDSEEEALAMQSLNSISALNSMNAINRIKMEDIKDNGSNGRDTDILARLRQQELDERQRDEMEREFKNARTQQEIIANLQRQMAAANQLISGLPGANFANLAASIVSSTGGVLPLNTVTSSANALTMAPTSTLLSSSSPSAASGSSGPSSSPAIQSIEAGKGYTFEEQFKQLYELSEDPKRKEFLDDIFSFMQKRGTPVNRIPIMAKQVLDLYELYRLVVARGGLVEVINKKIWREITKGLNLPSSITSAAFTLRTQYMKYLYPYECEKEKLSSPDELQSAIDGNRREGRRSSYGQYPEMMGATPPPQHMNRNQGGHHHTSPLSLVSRPLNGHNSQGLSSEGEEDNGSRSPPSHPFSTHHPLPQSEALNLEVTPRNASEATLRALEARTKMEDALGVTPAKRFLTDEERFLMQALPNVNIKVMNRDGRSQIESQLAVSMEINGIVYHGTLYAQTTRSRHS
ncbi:AT-rich interactive domain-containing protein 3C-like [Oppia nitens]|uniref:AT-rich interactive domain-containing protein 3C-like n=1 Tax=Oppia nitens TaxID=1686743 RepID=UPI0023DA4D3A|nr:AT-rich interactive domain-containing protein 3C-like [Oppia nitens]